MQTGFKKKWLLVMVFVLVASVALFGCGGGNTGGTDTGGADTGDAGASGGDSAEVYDFILAHTMAPETSFGEACIVLEEELKDSGLFNVTIHGGGTLGTETDCLQATQMGEIQGYMTVSGTVSNFIPSVVIFDDPMPWLGDTNEGIEIGIGIYSDPEFREVMNNTTDGTGLIISGYSTMGYRQLTCNTLIDSMDDFNGLVLRTLSSPVQMEMVNSWGATATAMAFSELFSGLQQGVIDGQCQPPEGNYNNKLYELQDYYYDSNHTFHVVVWVVNEDWYNTLSADAKTVFDSAMEHAQARFTEFCLDSEPVYAQLFEEEGMHFQALPRELKQQMYDSAEGARSMLAEAAGQEVYDAYFAAKARMVEELGYTE